MIERRSGTYVSCKYTKETNQKLAAWCLENSILEPLQPRHYHTTILYSRPPVVNAEAVLMLQAGLEFTAKAFHLFDSRENPTKAALVLELDAPELIDAHQRLITAGGTHDYNDFTPHITISYSASANTDLSSLILPTFKFILSLVKVEPLDVNWTA